MARGWESKSVESQIEAAETRQLAAESAALTAEQTRIQRERESLLLSRKRVLNDLESAANPPYRRQLTAALEHLDAKLASLESD